MAILVFAAVLGWRFLGTPDVETAVKADAAQSGPEDRLSALETQVKSEPENVSAWEALGSLHFEAGRFAKAADAYRRATQLRPDVAMLWSSLGEAIVMASEKDPMPADALAAFRKAHEIDAKEPRARYFLAVARDQDQDHEGAIADWLALLADTPPGAPWEQDLRRTIEQAGKIYGIETKDRIAAVKQPASELPEAARGVSGPTREQMDAAATMSPSQQRAMVEGMVEQLEARLKTEPNRVDGWLMLIRSRMSLGQPDLAKKALAEAIAANPAQAATLHEQAATLGVN